VRSRTVAAIAALSLALAYPLAGCGDDDGSDTNATNPTATEPAPTTTETTTTTGATTTTAPTTTTTQEQDGSGGVAPTTTTTTPSGGGQDGLTPQERFERFCERHPEACG
jgi:hypothetical protein